jgi:hypothetical protein
MFDRFIKKSFLKGVKTFPVIILTGARQTGKSTLCKTLLKNSHEYLSLEDPDIRRQATEDPRTFLKNHPAPVIIDEIQYAPELPSYIQGIVDENRTKYGQYVLTGSQNFLLMARVSQSLAGRAALFTMHPCSVGEIDGKKARPRSNPSAVSDWILRGGYPELRTRPELDRKTWCASYIRLYLERDVRQILNVGDLDTFERFLHLVAARTGQILNMSDLARDTGVSVPTAARWISLLQASYQVYILRPFHANLSKRLIKAPKIYFGDTALASYLMAIHAPEILQNSSSLGALFETAVFLEHIKFASFSGDMPGISYFRSNDGLEADLLIEHEKKLFLREIKSSRTLVPSDAENLLKIEKILKRTAEKSIMAPVEKSFKLKENVTIQPWDRVDWE